MGFSRQEYWSGLPFPSPWCWGRLKARGEGAIENEMAGWHHRLYGHEFEQTSGDMEGQGSLVSCSPWVSKSRTRLSDQTTKCHCNPWTFFLECPGGPGHTQLTPTTTQSPHPSVSKHLALYGALGTWGHLSHQNPEIRPRSFIQRSHLRVSKTFSSSGILQGWPTPPFLLCQIPSSWPGKPH